jgi:hypothetical protein
MLSTRVLLWRPIVPTHTLSGTGACVCSRWISSRFLSLTNAYLSMLVHGRLPSNKAMGFTGGHVALFLNSLLTFHCCTLSS